MMKVFLVDDEIAIRENLRNSFPWEEKGYQLVGEAPDGEMALPMLRDLNADILLTDIRMPFMDGIRLCEEVQRTMPWVERIILSGYDDFAYAQKAISLGVREYLLKPVTAQELEAALNRVSQKIEEKRREHENLTAMRERLSSGNQFLRDKLLASLFTDEGDPQDDDALLSQMRGLGINLSASCYTVIDIAFDADGEERLACRNALYSLAEMSGGGVFVCGAPKGARALVLGDRLNDAEERAYSFANSVIHLPELRQDRNCGRRFSGLRPRQKILCGRDLRIPAALHVLLPARHFAYQRRKRPPGLLPDLRRHSGGLCRLHLQVAPRRNFGLLRRRRRSGGNSQNSLAKTARH